MLSRITEYTYRSLKTALFFSPIKIPPRRASTTQKRWATPQCGGSGYLKDGLSIFEEVLSPLKRRPIPQCGESSYLKDGLSIFEKALSL